MNLSAGLAKTSRRFLPHALAAATILVAASGAGPAAKRKANADEDAKAEAALPPLNRKVLEFARGRLGEKVGDGQCTSLASAALREAGARRSPRDRGDGDFTWGRPVASFREALPGDVVQFRDAVYKGKTWVTRRRWESWHEEYPHHTAIVSSVRDGGKIVVLLHQNVGPQTASPAARQVVTESTLRADSLQDGGRVWVYRPVDPDEPDDGPGN